MRGRHPPLLAWGRRKDTGARDAVPPRSWDGAQLTASQETGPQSYKLEEPGSTSLQVSRTQPPPPGLPERSMALPTP